MPPGVPQGLKSSFYALSGSSTGSDEAGSPQTTPIPWLEARKGPTPLRDEHCAVPDARFTFRLTAGPANSLGPRGRHDTLSASSDGVILTSAAFCQEKARQLVQE